MSSIVTLRSQTTYEFHRHRLGIHRTSGLGVATILGSAWIAFLLIPACCTFLAGQDIHVSRNNLMRDILFYLLALTFLYYFGRDQIFTFEECLCLLLGYVSYICAVIAQSIRAPKEMRDTELLDRGTELFAGEDQPEPLAEYEESFSIESDAQDTQKSTKSTKIFDILKSPMMYLFSRTAYIDIEENQAHESYFLRTMVVSFLWVSLFSWIITIVVSRWVTLSGMSSGFFGVVMVSFGGQIPDAIQSIAAAKKGYGSMALSNALGSQNLNMFMGLGLPWLLCTMFGDADGVAISHTYGLFVTGWMTLGIVIFFILATIALSARRNGLFSPVIMITKPTGVAMFLFYVLCIVLFALIMFFHT